MSTSAEQAFWKHMSYLPSIGSPLSMMTRNPGFNSIPIGSINRRSLRFSSPCCSNTLTLIIGGWSAEVEKSRMVAQASLPVLGSLAQNLAHCGSGDTRSTFEGGRRLGGRSGLPRGGWSGRLRRVLRQSGSCAEDQTQRERRGAEARHIKTHPSSFQAVRNDRPPRAQPRFAARPDFDESCGRQYGAKAPAEGHPPRPRPLSTFGGTIQ